MNIVILFYCFTVTLLFYLFIFFLLMKIMHCTSRVECKDNISSYVACTKYVP